VIAEISLHLHAFPYLDGSGWHPIATLDRNHWEASRNTIHGKREFLYRDNLFRPLDDNDLQTKKQYSHSTKECTPAPRIANSQRSQKKPSVTTNSPTFTAAKIKSLKDRRRVSCCDRSPIEDATLAPALIKKMLRAGEKAYIEIELIGSYLLYGF
jgi:hypothetical protein